jgi:hypothetical protein
MQPANASGSQISIILKCATRFGTRYELRPLPVCTAGRPGTVRPYLSMLRPAQTLSASQRLAIEAPRPSLADLRALAAAAIGASPVTSAPTDSNGATPG